MRVRLTAGAILVALLGVASALASPATAATTPSAYGSRLVTLINQARAQQGLRALSVAGGTSAVAGNWTSHMASNQGLSHNPNLGAQLESHGSPNWTTYAENVAMGSTSSADAMFTDYMNSPEHRSNILDGSMRYVGVGVVFTGSTAWNTLDFVDQYNSTSTSSSTTTTKTTTKTTTTTSKTTTQAPRIAVRTASRATTAAKPTRHTATRTTVRATASHVRHIAAKPRPVTRHATTVSATVPAAAVPIAHVIAGPSPAALTVPVRNGGGDNHSLAIVAALGILFVIGAQIAVRRSLRTR